MCTTDSVPYLRSDGTYGRERVTRRCSAYRRGEDCGEPAIFHHDPPHPAAPTPPNPLFTINPSHLPPSPRHTPANSSPATTYYSASEDSGSNSSRRRRRSHEPVLMVNGHEINIEPSRPRRRSSHYRRPSSGSASTERIIIVEGPPTPRTPPQAHGMPRTAPPSPSMPSPLSERERHRHRPVIVDERPKRQVRVETPEETDRRHRRESSQSSFNTASSSASDEERRRRRRDEREEKRERQRGDAEDEARRQRREARIEEANRKIAMRPAQTVPRRATTTYVRPTVEMPGLGVEVDGRRRSPRREEWREEVDEEEEVSEEEAQRQRLKERLMPSRRASIGAGSRRVRVELGNGVYRLE